MTLAGPKPRTFAGHDGLREAWDQGRANWETFRFAVHGERDGVLEVGFSGIERLQRIEISGVLWFRVQERDGRIVRLWSALDAGDLPSGRGAAGR